MRLLLLLAAAASAAQPPGEAIRAEAAALVDLFYGHEFEKAVPAAEELERRHPGHPAGPLFRAVVAYQLWVAEGLPDDGSWDAVERDLARALEAARRLEPSAPAEADYYAGAALGFRARGLAARRRFLRALPDASASLRRLKSALERDPSLTDARLGLGMYHYFAARMPGAARPLARLLLGETGDRARGLEELWAVARSSGAARMEARSVLSMILSKDDEADWAGAERLLAELASRYPRNPVFRLRRALVAAKRGDCARALAFADPGGAWLDALHPGARPAAEAAAAYRGAECRLLQGRYDQAEALLSRIDEERAPEHLRGWLELRRGNLADARGRRDEAKSFYARASGRRVAPLAKAFLRTPFPQGPRDTAPYFAGY